ncbi:hypothetical protein [Pontibacter populi]|uniref:Phenylacetate--CoA ligase family protein n=1 Tax=Pontibacter populi TaxID=890055 RepID=A0ABV1RVT0_9BACT
MSLAVFFKNNLKNIPPHIGTLINKVPYSYRPGLGKIYEKRKAEIETFDTSKDVLKLKEFIFTRMYEITNYAYHNIPFYKEYYDTHNFIPASLRCFGDLQKIPIVNKGILRNYNVEQRSALRKSRYIVNTGGSSGTPFSLYIEPESMGHEWAHMHHIWGKLNYKPSDLKLVFGGRSDLKELVEYDVIRNHFAVDIYASYSDVSKKLKKVLTKYEIKYLHGYPSSIYDFAVYCRDYDTELKEKLSNMLVGAFLGSEYPQPHYRKVIEDTFGVKSISWYGHTERCVLAYEKNAPFVYAPFQTYGFTEAVESDEDHNLVSTNYYNYASPLIRYNTEDIISDLTYEGEILNSFKITKGREGEFVIDKSGKKINLTGLIFGRHHDLFNFSKFIQVKQIEKGKIEINFVSETLREEEAERLFDTRNLNFEVKFVKRIEPYRTSSGKINLLVK